MSAKITDLVMRLRNQIRDNGATQAFPDNLDSVTHLPTPGSSPELQQFIQDAIMAYSRYRPRRCPITLSLVPGQKTYTLPNDWVMADMGSFQRAISPAPLPDPDVFVLPFIYTAQPLGVQVNTMHFRWYDDDQTLILSSDPILPQTFTFDYLAYHTADGTGTTLPAPMQYYALLPAAENALRAIATDYAVKLQKYKVGGRYGIDVDDSKVSENLKSQADEYRALFEKEIIFKAYATSGGDDRWQ